MRREDRGQTWRLNAAGGWNRDFPRQIKCVRTPPRASHRRFSEPQTLLSTFPVALVVGRRRQEIEIVNAMRRRPLARNIIKQAKSLTYCGADGTARRQDLRQREQQHDRTQPERQRWTGHAGSGWARFSTPDRNSLPGLSGRDGAISNQAGYAANAFVSTSSQHTFSDHVYLAARL